MQKGRTRGSKTGVRVCAHTHTCTKMGQKGERREIQEGRYS